MGRRPFRYPRTQGTPAVSDDTLDDLVIRGLETDVQEAELQQVRIRALQAAVKLAVSRAETAERERDEARADAERLGDRVESLRGLCKSAVGALRDADAPNVATEIAELIGDMEHKSAAREVREEGKR